MISPRRVPRKGADGRTAPKGRGFPGTVPLEIGGRCSMARASPRSPRSKAACLVISTKSVASRYSSLRKEHTRQALARARDQPRQAGHLPPVSSPDRDGLSRYSLPISGSDLGGNVGLMQAVRRFEPEGLPARDLCDVVDQGGDPGVHPAFVEPRRNGSTTKTNRSVSSSICGG